MRASRLVSLLLITPFAIAIAYAGPPDSSFNRIKLLVPIGEKVEETDVVLRLSGDRLIITTVDGNVELKNFPYSRITEAGYSYSKHPRWKEGKKGLVFLPVFFVKGKKHWLTIEADKDYAVLKLDKENYRVVIPAFESRSHVKVESLGEEK
jgi:hypothetical protein